MCYLRDGPSRVVLLIATSYPFLVYCFFGDYLIKTIDLLCIYLSFSPKVMAPMNSFRPSYEWEDGGWWSMFLLSHKFLLPQMRNWTSAHLIKRTQWILNIPIPMNDIQDKLIWKFSSESSPSIIIFSKTVTWTNNDQIYPHPRVKLLNQI